ncbi:MAG TPA: PKD domain-containing protein [Thermoplasmata archaeon]|nr:PKD domain-containing protein [Thermoplasmata archaeon]
MRPRTILAVGLVALMVVSAWGALPTGAGGRSPAPIASIPPQALATDPFAAESRTEIAPGLSLSPGERSVGPTNGSAPMEVAVGLAPQDPVGLVEFLNELYAPGSGEFRAFLSPAQLADRYGAAPASLAAARSYFEGFGLDVTVSPDRLLLDVSGPTSSVGRAFNTTFDELQDGSGTPFVSHATPASLPSDLPWTGALGLGDADAIHPAVAAAGSAAIAGPAASCASSGGIVPCQVWGAYDLADDEANGTDGAGETIGVVDTYDAAEPASQLAADLGSFDADFGLPTPTVRFLYPVSTSGDLNSTDTGWGFEEALDLEWSHAIAPGAAIDMTFSPNAGVGLYEAVDDLVARDLVNVISLSWGEPDVGVFNAYAGACSAACNASTDGSYSVLSPVLEFAAAEGISVFAATGDCGAADGTSGVSTNYPASDPYVTGVGGTQLSVSATGVWENETGWNGNRTGATPPGCENQGGSGGGYSPFPRPYWQYGPGIPSGASRADPDVAAVAAPGVDIVYGGAVGGVEGTSVATPIWAGIAAMADQQHGAELGFLDPSLYGILQHGSYATDFHNITSGNNGYRASGDWSAVTGLGSPNAGGALIADLASTPVGFSSLAISLTASRVAGPAPLSVTFFANATGGSGADAIEGVDFGDGTAAPTTAGEAAHIYASPGVYPAQAYVFDGSDNVSDSIPIAIVVGGGSTLSVTLAASNDTPSAASTVEFTAAAAGGTGAYTYDFSFGDGTFLNNTSSPVTDHAYPAYGGFCAVVIAGDAGSPPDGGESEPVAIAVDGAPVPTCPLARGTLTLAAASDVGVRDAPADFPGLFTISGGAGGFTEQLASSDPYVAACDRAIFRTPGQYQVTMFVNSTTEGDLRATTNVTVAAPLEAQFDVAPTPDPGPPLLLVGSADVSGGYGVNSTRWTLGNGLVESGNSITGQYAQAGVYWLVVDVSDQGFGNASEAFLVDVGALEEPIAATVAPAVNAPSGATVQFNVTDLPATGGPFGFDWDLDGAAAAYAANFSRTFYAPAESAPTFALSGSLSVVAPGTGASESVAFSFGGFFAVEPGGFVPSGDALVLTDSTGPSLGMPPLSWSGNATVSGPGTTEVAWDFGDGLRAGGAAVSTTFATAGNFTVQVEATDSWGDSAWDDHGVEVSTSPFSVDVAATPENGTPPLEVQFSVTVAGGVPPFAYAWDFGDGTTSDAANASHSYAGVGTYSAELSVRDAQGVSVQRSVSIRVGLAPATGGEVSGLELAALFAAVGAGTGGLVATIWRRRDPPPSP